MDLIALVHEDIKDLVATFLRSRREELENLEKAVNQSSWSELEFFGERMYEVGNPYGFRYVSTLGREVREACAARNLQAIRQITRRYREYLGKVEIRTVPKDAERIAWAKQRTERSALAGRSSTSISATKQAAKQREPRLSPSVPAARPRRQRDRHGRTQSR